MRAAICRDGKMNIGEIEVPQPGPGQVLVKTRHCGICGSDLHLVHEFEEFAELGRRAGIATGKMQSELPLVPGHEFSAEIVEYGPRAENTLTAGSLICSLPLVVGEDYGEALGFSHRFNGGFAEYMLLSESLVIPVTNGLPADQAALAEPMAVAAQAIARAELVDSCIMVIGCGPIGQAIIRILKARGIGPIIASDPIAGRRAAAERLGADKVVDPTVEDPHESWEEFGLTRGAVSYPRKPVERRPFVFECSGAKGILANIINGAPRATRIVIPSIATGLDSIETAMATNKEAELRFCMGYTADIFRETVESMCSGELPVADLIGSSISLDDLPAALDDGAVNGDGGKVLVSF